MVKTELVVEIPFVVKNSLKEFGDVDLILFFKNAIVDENTNTYDLNNQYPWKLVISVSWLKETGIKKPLSKLSEDLFKKFSDREKEIHLIKFLSPEEPFIKEIKNIVKKYPQKLDGISTPNIYIVEGMAFN